MVLFFFGPGGGGSWREGGGTMAASVVVFPTELEFRSSEPVQRLEMCNLHMYPVQFVSKYQHQKMFSLH